MNFKSIDTLAAVVILSVISGLLLPAAMKFFETYLSRRLERSNEIRKNQMEILNQLTDSVWQYRFLAKQVAYYGSFQNNDADLKKQYREAAKNYDAQVWTRFIMVKKMKSQAIVWFEPEVSQRLVELYSFLKDNLDRRISRAMFNAKEGSKAQLDEWAAISDYFTDEVSKALEDHIGFLASRVLKPAI